MKRYIALSIDISCPMMSIDKEVLHKVHSIIRLIDYSLPDFISKKFKKINLCFTNNPQKHGETFRHSFLFYLDQDKIKNTNDAQLAKTITSILKSGLIKMGSNYDWNEERINTLFQSIEKNNLLITYPITNYIKIDEHKFKLHFHADGNSFSGNFDLKLERIYKRKKNFSVIGTIRSFITDKDVEKFSYIKGRKSIFIQIKGYAPIEFFFE